MKRTSNTDMMRREMSEAYSTGLALVGQWDTALRNDEETADLLVSLVESLGLPEGDGLREELDAVDADDEDAFEIYGGIEDDAMESINAGLPASVKAYFSFGFNGEQGTIGLQPHGDHEELFDEIL